MAQLFSKESVTERPYPFGVFELRNFQLQYTSVKMNFLKNVPHRYGI